MTSIKDVARDAGVSIATVSYVLNHSKQVSPEAEQRVLSSIRKLNYNANQMARGLRSKQSCRIGVMLQNIRNPFFPSVLAGMEEAARDYGYSLTFLNSYNDPNVEKKDMITLKQMWVDGVILDSCVDEDQRADYIDFLKELMHASGKRTPIVMLERNFSDAGIPSVCANYYEASYASTRHMISTGKRQIVHYTALSRWDMLLERCRGYVQAMTDSGLSENVVIKKGEMSASDGYAFTQALIGGGQPFDGIFAVNDQQAIGAMKALNEKGIAIPDGVAVIGFDNIAISSLITPQLTTTDVPRYKMGYKAVDLLVNSIRGGAVISAPLVLETKLIVRGSTDKTVKDSWDFREI